MERGKREVADWREIPVKPTPGAVRALKGACPVVESLPFDPLPVDPKEGVDPSPASGFRRAHPLFFEEIRESYWRERLWSDLEVFLKVRPRKLYWDEVILGFMDLVRALCRRSSEFFLRPSMEEALQVSAVLQALRRLCQETESKGVSDGILRDVSEMVSEVLDADMGFLASNQSMLLVNQLLDTFRRCLPMRASCWVEFALQCHACVHRGVRAKEVLEDLEPRVEGEEDCRERVERVVELAISGLEERLGGLVGRYRLGEVLSSDVEEFAERVTEGLVDALSLHAKPVLALAEEPERTVEEWLSVPEVIEVGEVKVGPEEYDPVWEEVKRTERAFARIDVGKAVRERFRRLVKELRDRFGSGR